MKDLFLNWFKSSSVIKTAFTLFIIGLILTIIAAIISNEAIKFIINAVAQTFMSVGILLGVFQIPIIQEEVSSFLSDLASDVRFLRHLQRSSLKKLTEQSLHAYAKNIKEPSFIEQFIDMIESNDDHYVENLQIAYDICKDSSGYIKLRKKVNKTVEIVATDRTDLSSLIKKTISTRVSFEEAEDKLKFNKVDIRIGKEKITLNKEELDDIIREEEERESPGYTIRYLIDVNLLMKKIEEKCKSNNQCKFDIKNLESGTKILLELEEIRETSLKSKKIVHRVPALTKGIVVSVFTDGEIKVDGELFVNNAKKSWNNITKKKLDNGLFLATREWIFPGNGYIIFIE